MSHQEVEAVLFPLIYFSVGKYARLQVDLLPLPCKEDLLICLFFGSALREFSSVGRDEGRGGGPGMNATVHKNARELARTPGGST